MEHTLEEIGAKMDALGLWGRVFDCHWAVKPRGSAFPYFFAALRGDPEPVKVRILFLDGWQTFNDFLHIKADPFFGFYSTPMEIPHFEVVILRDGAVKGFRHDPCFMPVEVNEAQRALCTKLLWEVYGVLLRLESEPGLPMMYAAEKSIFARVEGKDGRWTDGPLELVPPRPHVEQVSFAKADLAKAKDRPFDKDGVLSVDFRLQPRLMTREKRPRPCYVLLGVDPKTGACEIHDQVSPDPEGGLRGLWESMPVQLLKRLIERNAIPGEIRCCSARVFRLLRPLLIELPIKLSLNLNLPELQEK